MKLIVAGSTGFVATELIKQALSSPDITSIIALARRETSVPQTLDGNADIAKFKAVVCDDFSNYSDSVKKELEGAEACIWLIAITPSKMKDSTLDEARKICLEYTVTGLETITQLSREKSARPFRFIYISGHKSERDQSRQPWVMGDYLLMRGEAESRVIDFAQASNGTVEACIAKPGLIDGPDRRQGLVGSVLSTIGRSLIGLPKVDVSQIAATLLEQAVKGIEKETLSNEDLVRIGNKVLSA
ncbi:putative nucleoside-diphosphate-sugar epimerase protein [Botrytis fragariae]|uniref:Putative nucleoside-diphosphate-sugar epimerase protein n=1 Tax=Botrytis fragariae TaxID=1964551 RepID=A0A8H6EPB5_9HELO|nr:putative nucleoside-diphosphate-sugar epimerase protein [Botrytis fragariae]KAF5879573.1 putative nucleoside-diphosphate-sugar epimerase protein [Botrytis fragariae]